MQPVITDRKLFSGHFEALFLNATISIFLTDIKGKIIAANPFALKVFGYTENEVENLPVDMLIPKRFRKHHQEYHSTFFKNPGTRVMDAGRDLFALKKDGTEIPVEISFSHYIQNCDEYVMVFLTDISTRKKSEQKLTAEYARMKLIIEHAPAAIAVLDRDLNYKVVSKRWMKDFNLGDRDITGLNHYDIFSDIPEEWKKFHKLCLEGKSISRQEDILKKSDGETEWLRWEICPWYEDNQKPGGIIIFSEVITEQKRNLESLKVSEARLATEAEMLTLLNEAGNRLWRKDSFENGLEEMLDYSARLFGTKMGSIQLYNQEKHTLEIVASKGLSPSYLKYFNSVPVNGNTPCATSFNERSQVAVEDVESDVRTHSCVYIYREAGIRGVQSTPLYATDGSLIGIISSYFSFPRVFNSLELKRMNLYARAAESFITIFRMNNQLHEINEELEEKVKERTNELLKLLANEKKLSELKSRFVSMASHEFRTPLSTILSSAYLLEKYTTTEDQVKRERHLQRITSSVNMLSGILNDFLSAGKIEEGKIHTRFADITINGFISDIADEIKNTLKAGQTIQYRYYGGMSVFLDPTLLKLIVMNLISNASKFSHEYNTIELSTFCNDTSFILIVKDYGIGISKEDQQHLMERFFRGANAANIQGTGLGLHIVSKYTELMNGKVECISEPGTGTEFIITFNTKISDNEKDIID